MTDPWSFSRFDPGQSFGTLDIPLDDERRAQWTAIFGDPGDTPPRGVLVAAMMEAFIRAIQPRPKGNVHAAQVLDFRPGALHWGDTVSVAVACAAKEEKKGRFWVDFGVDCRTGGQSVMPGAIKVIWAI